MSLTLINAITNYKNTESKLIKLLLEKTKTNDDLKEYLNIVVDNINFNNKQLEPYSKLKPNNKLELLIKLLVLHKEILDLEIKSVSNGYSQENAINQLHSTSCSVFERLKTLK